MNSKEDVYKWLLSLDKDYVTYAKTFKKRNIDGYRLLNDMDDEKLFNYGVASEDHRQAILDEIEKLKKRCPVKFTTSEN